MFSSSVIGVELERPLPADTVALLLSHRAISPNGVHPPGSGTTPLHLAASLGRVDVVNLLLEQDGVNDTLRDGHGRSCQDVAKGKDVAKAIEGLFLLPFLTRHALTQYLRFPFLPQRILSLSPPQLYSLRPLRRAIIRPHQPLRITSHQVCQSILPRRRLRPVSPP